MFNTNKTVDRKKKMEENKPNSLIYFSDAEKKFIQITRKEFVEIFKKAEELGWVESSAKMVLIEVEKENLYYSITGGRH